MANVAGLLKLLGTAAQHSWAGEVFALAKNQGFEQVVYGVIPDRNQPLESAFLCSNYSKTWRNTYDRNRFHYIDPTVEHCLHSSLPLIWGPQTFRKPAQKSLYEEACSHGLRSGIIFPIHGPHGEFGVLGFATDHAFDHKFRRQLSHSLDDLALMRDYVFESSLKFVSAANTREAARKAAEVSLTHRELECLKWLMVGKSSWEISRILRCSSSTVDFHVSNIREKFRVRTRHQAVVKAIQLGILVPA